MEVIGLLIETLMSWFSKLPIEFLLAILLGLMGYIVKRINQMQKTFVDDVNALRSEQSKMKQEYIQSAEELKAAINKLSVDLSKELEIQRDGLSQNYLLALRTAVVNSSFPKSYRLEKYDEYHKLGGNTFVDEYVKNTLLKDDGEDD